MLSAPEEEKPTITDKVSNGLSKASEAPGKLLGSVSEEWRERRAQAATQPITLPSTETLFQKGKRIWHNGYAGQRPGDDHKDMK